MKETQSNNEASSGTSALDDELVGVWLSNAELSAAIQAAYQRVRETGSIFSHHRLLEGHLSALLSCERERAKSCAAIVQKCIDAINESQPPGTTPWDCVDAIKRKFRQTPGTTRP